MRFRSCCVLVLCALASFAEAQPGCQSIYLPDLAPPIGVPTGTTLMTFPVPPTTVDLMYPFDLRSVKTGPTTATVWIDQIVGDASKRHRVFQNVTSISGVFLTWFVSDVLDYMGTTYVKTFDGSWKPWGVQMLGYKTLPATVQSSPGVERTWDFRAAPRFSTREENVNLSMPVQLGEGWNVGIFAPHGLAAAGLQVEFRICQQP